MLILNARIRINNVKCQIQSDRVDSGYHHFLFQEDVSFPMINGLLSQLDKHVTSEVTQKVLLTALHLCYVSNKTRDFLGVQINHVHL